ncbi:hypothetical protein [Prevotella falsenii]|uniref:hypothetical protein n=1 Tax=Prevotella falsenii TaxID=515414 RepID=UPI0012EC305F|nr:hypothetical protein [Prevotella falsenii]
MADLLQKKCKQGEFDEFINTRKSLRFKHRNIGIHGVGTAVFTDTLQRQLP